MQQHFIDTSINITELESTKKPKKLPKNVDTLRKGWQGGRKLTERETNILARTQVPHSVWENFVSSLFRKLSRQKNVPKI